MRKRIVSATEFKAKCLALLDEIEKSGDAVTVTKRGRPVAVLGPVESNAWKSPRDSGPGGEIVGDIVGGNGEDLWDVARAK